MQDRDNAVHLAIYRPSLGRLHSGQRLTLRLAQTAHLTETTAWDTRAQLRPGLTLQKLRAALKCNPGTEARQDRREVRAEALDVPVTSALRVSGSGPNRKSQSRARRIL